MPTCRLTVRSLPMLAAANGSLFGCMTDFDQSQLICAEQDVGRGSPTSAKPLISVLGKSVKKTTGTASGIHVLVLRIGW